MNGYFLHSMSQYHASVEDAETHSQTKYTTFSTDACHILAALFYPSLVEKQYSYPVILPSLISLVYRKPYQPKDTHP